MELIENWLNYENLQFFSLCFLLLNFSLANFHIVFYEVQIAIIHNISLLVLLIGAVITFNETIGISRTILFNESIVVDYLSSFMKIITLISAFVVSASTEYIIESSSGSKTSIV